MCALLVSVTNRLGRRAPADPATVMSGPLLLARACAVGARVACTLSLRFKAVLWPAAPALLETVTGWSDAPIISDGFLRVPGTGPGFLRLRLRLMVSFADCALD